MVVKVSKKSEKHVEPEPVEPTKEIVPSNTGVFKRLKKKAHRSRNSTEQSSSLSPSMVKKPNITRRGLVIREVPVPISPSLKKWRAEDVAKHISKNRRREN